MNSYKLAKQLGKRHDNLKRIIEGFRPALGARFGEVFKMSTFKNSNNQVFPCYLISQEGYDLLNKPKNTPTDGKKKLDAAIYDLGDVAKAIKTVFAVDNNKAFDVAANMVEKTNGVDLSALRGLVPKD